MGSCACDYRNFAASGFSEQDPPDVLDIRHMRRGYFAATSFTDAQLGRVMDALDSEGPSMADQTITMLWSDHGWHLGDTNSWCKVTNFETGARNSLLWRVPGGMYTGFTSRLVEMVDLYPTLVELAKLPPVPKCVGDPEANVHCLQGTSYASAFGVGTAAPRTAVTHQWPYSTYLGDAKGLLSNSTPGVPGVKFNPNCSTLAGIQWKTQAEADAALATCPKTMAYAIRTDRYRYIANVHYDDAKFRPIWSPVISRQLYDYETDPHETVGQSACDSCARLFCWGAFL